MSNARNLADLLGTSTKANQVISTSGAITTTGAFTSVGIDDNADATTMTIDTSENIGIGNTSPSSQYMTRLVVGDGSGTEGITIYSGNDSQGRLEFSDATSGDGRYAGGVVYNHSTNKLRFNTNGGNERLGIDSSGNVTLNAGNLVMANGQGIDFSNTGDGFVAAGSELLDDYEEGVYTLSFNGFANQTVSQGWYTKVGRLCYITTFLHASGSQNTNSFTCDLPFTAASHSASNNSGYYIGSIGAVMHYRVDTGSAGMVSYVAAGTAQWRLYEVNADGDWVFMQNNAFTSEDQAWISFTYVTAS